MNDASIGGCKQENEIWRSSFLEFLSVSVHWPIDHIPACTFIYIPECVVFVEGLGLG